MTTALNSSLDVKMVKGADRPDSVDVDVAVLALRR